MKAASLNQIKKELEHRSEKEVLEFCLRLARFKLENKELLTYLLFEADDELNYINEVKRQVDLLFEDINRTNLYWVKKSVRKIQRMLRKYVRYSGNKETEVELMIYFCTKLNDFTPSIFGNKAMLNLYRRQMAVNKKNIKALHEDLQHDYLNELENLNI